MSRQGSERVASVRLRCGGCDERFPDRPAPELGWVSVYGDGRVKLVCQERGRGRHLRSPGVVGRSNYGDIFELVDGIITLSGRPVHEVTVPGCRSCPRPRRRPLRLSLKRLGEMATADYSDILAYSNGPLRGVRRPRDIPARPRASGVNQRRVTAVRDQ